ncbi:MAG: response regulator [Cyanobacteriota bacterium]|nr:response regulator [Cyanobacteriota bacterium]
MTGYDSLEPQGIILLVDDTLENLEVLDGLLTEHGYDVRQATDGQMALMGVEADPPDLILLDIMMPEMNGYEVCQRLKSKPETWDIPVIFISALDDAFDKVKAFEVGGVDYIPKPFQTAEALARVNNQMAISRLQKLLQKNTELQFAQYQAVVAERDRMQQAFLEASRKYDEFFQKAPIGIYHCSPAGRYLEVNPALARIFGYTAPHEWIPESEGTGIPIPYVDENQWERFASQIEHHGSVVSMESAVYRKDGSETIILESAYPVKDAQGYLVYYEGFAQELVSSL